MNTKTFKIGAFQQKLFWLLSGFLLLTLMSYLYLINNLIFNVANRETLLQTREQLTFETSSLESQYLALVKTITVERAFTLGFEEVKAESTSFAALPPLHLVRR